MPRSGYSSQVFTRIGSTQTQPGMDGWFQGEMNQSPLAKWYKIAETSHIGRNANMKLFLMLTLTATLFAGGTTAPTLTATPQTVSVMDPVTFTLTAKTSKGYYYYLENVDTGQRMTQFNVSQTPDSVTIGISTTGTHQFCVDQVSSKGQNLGCIATTTVAVN